MKNTSQQLNQLISQPSLKILSVIFLGTLFVACSPNARVVEPEANVVEETEELRINHTRKSEMKNVVALLGEQRVSKKEEGEVVALLGVQRVSKGEGVVALNGELCVSKEEEDGEERVDLLREEEVIMVFEDDNGGKDLTVITIDEHDDDDEINDNLLSSEDLNKKCEEFIRKMKAGIRSESRKLLTS